MAEPGVHPGNNNSLNNNDYKLLSGDKIFSESARITGVFRRETGAGLRVQIGGEQKGRRSVSINTACQHKQLH